MKSMRQDNTNSNKQRELRINGQIRARQVRLIDNTGTMLGVVDFYDALRQAKDISLDLVEVNPHDQIPTCKIMDFGKFKYDRDKKAKEAKKSRTVIETKEIKFRPTIGNHDFDVKMRQIRDFIDDGCKVHVSLQMRGRQIDHPEMAKLIMDRITVELGDYVTILSSESDEKSMSIHIIKNNKRQKVEQ